VHEFTQFCVALETNWVELQTTHSPVKTAVQEADGTQTLVEVNVPEAQTATQIPLSL
jgi:hypothetical protein